ncbi:cytochrome P450 [Prauserella muralis]|uniref:Cytochrome n=1 Tax=Prauserella muralis TaxID=588067 RepID=A0A2V4AMR2_9PSEU|nr:cytochrome P450 [Prauserella muralis]PXY21333.1 cytochrome [Prauserella muralis]TWE30459.1 cytochrome P450 [Prauserella muralis]
MTPPEAHQSADRELGDDFDPKAPETFTSAHALYAELRERCPVAHSNAYDGGFWALFRYADVHRVLREPAMFTTSVRNTVPKFAFTGRRPPLHLDPPEHTAYRRVINRFFTPTKMRALHPTVRQLAVEQLSPLIEAGAGDITVDYAHKFPAMVFAEFFNLPRELSALIKEISAAYVAAITAVDDETVKRLSGRLYEIAQQVIDERKTQRMDPDSDLTTALLQATHDGEPLPPEMVLGCVRQLLVTGMVAPSVFIGNMFVHLSQDRELAATLRSDPGRIPAAVEEFLRLYGPYRGMARTAREDVVFGDRLIKAGEPIALVYTSANRDSEVFPDGETFVLDRPNIGEHIAFGGGVHSCPGAPLARMMMVVTLEEALARTADFEVSGPIEMAKWAEWGTNSVPMRFVPARVEGRR